MFFDLQFPPCVLVVVVVGDRGSTAYKGAGHTGLGAPLLFLTRCSAWDSGI